MKEYDVAFYTDDSFERYAEHVVQAEDIRTALFYAAELVKQTPGNVFIISVLIEEVKEPDNDMDGDAA